MSYGFRARTSRRPMNQSNARRFLKRVENEISELIKAAPTVDEALKKTRTQKLKQHIDETFEMLFGEPR